VADEFLSAARDHDMAKAYSYLSDDFKQNTSEAELESYLDREGLTRFSQASWSNRSISGSRGTLSGSLTTESGGAIPLTLEFVKGEQGWKIFAIKKPAAGIQQETSSLSPPPEAELVRLVDETMREFALSVNEKSMARLYEYISDLWRQQTSVEDLNGVFDAFYGAGIDLTVLSKFSPIFATAPSVNPQGVLEVSGHYPTKPNQVYFEQKYVYEGLGWKLIGITVTVK